MNVIEDPCKTTIGCVYAATRILGDKWTPLLLRALLNDSPARFCQLQTMVGGINPRTLSARLRELESEKIIKKSPTSSETRFEYILTTKGKDLMPTIESMYAWSLKYADSAAVHES